MQQTVVVLVSETAEAIAMELFGMVLTLEACRKHMKEPPLSLGSNV